MIYKLKLICIINYEYYNLIFKEQTNLKVNNLKYLIASTYNFFLNYYNLSFINLKFYCFLENVKIKGFNESLKSITAFYMHLTVQTRIQLNHRADKIERSWCL